VNDRAFAQFVLRKGHQMGRRVYVGQLPGGPGSTPDPSFPFQIDIGTHAPGRLEAERKKLLHAVCFKAWGQLGDYPTISHSGAVYQDFKGTRNYQRCHRSLFEPVVNGFTIPDLTSRLGLRRILITPGGVTDPEPPPANYGDRLLEIVGTGPILELMRRTVARQPANRPLEMNLLQLALACELPALFQKGYDDALSKADDILKERGWIEVPITSKAPLVEAARIWAATAPRGRPELRATKEIEGLIQELWSSGPQSDLVSDRMDDLKFGFYEAGPSRYGRLAIDYLLQCQDITKQAPTTLVNMADIEQACDQLETAATADSGVAESD
jgi:hypothetical protein